MRRFVTAVVLSIGFGTKIDRDSDRFIQIATNASYAFGHERAPGSTPVDFFPILKNLPMLFHDRSLRFVREWRFAIRNLHGYTEVVSSVAIGVPHRSLEADVYEGYFIPAGSLVYASARAMPHDSRVYSNVDEFDPDRFLPTAEGGRGEPLPAGQFGFGRRVCVGKHVAEATVWIVIACMLSTMRIEQARDGAGRELEPQVELTNGLTSHPKKLPCRIVPRDGRSKSAIDLRLCSART
ncbi:unnamed protein product, partial [Clonostachys byssicola]